MIASQMYQIGAPRLKRTAALHLETVSLKTRSRKNSWSSWIHVGLPHPICSQMTNMATGYRVQRSARFTPGMVSKSALVLAAELTISFADIQS